MLKNREKSQINFVNFQINQMSIDELKSLVAGYLHEDYNEENDEEFFETLEYCNFTDYE